MAGLRGFQLMEIHVATFFSGSGAWNDPSIRPWGFGIIPVQDIQSPLDPVFGEEE